MQSNTPDDGSSHELPVNPQDDLDRRNLFVTAEDFRNLRHEHKAILYFFLDNEKETGRNYMHFTTISERFPELGEDELQTALDYLVEKGWLYVYRGTYYHIDRFSGARGRTEDYRTLHGREV